jgi:hypothetical protein
MKPEGENPMGNITDYIHWRGDLIFSKDPLNDIDVLILSLLSYLPFKGIVPGIETKEKISLEEAAAQFFLKFPLTESKSVSFSSTASPSFNTEVALLLQSSAHCPRFENVLLSGYEENSDLVVGRQFAAVTYTLPNTKHEKVIAFRGTDSSIMGWKEDFELAYMEQIPAQSSARDYLNRTIHLFSGKFVVCGHSKGGNLAVYAGTFFNPRYQWKLSRIVNFDGPGFDFSIVDRAPFLKHEQKVINYVPSESMVGLLLDAVGARSVVSSTARFVLQHDAFTWEVEGSGFVAESLSKNATFLEQILKTWLKEIAVEERKIFLEALFDILGASEGKAVTLNPQEGLKELKVILAKYAKLDEKTRALLTQVFTALTAETQRRVTTVIKDSLPKIL